MRAVVLTYVVSRVLVGLLAFSPELYPDGSADPTFDVVLYEGWMDHAREGLSAYRDFAVEYPPGALAVAAGAAALPIPFRTAFLVENFLWDAIGFWAVLRVARRRDNWYGVVAWLILLPLLGPVAFSRLDLPVAACIAWAMERIERARWDAGAVWLGLGAAIKLVPGLLLVPAVVSSPRRWRAAAVGALAAAVFVLPFLRHSRAIYEQVVTRNSVRGLHVESLWGSILALVDAVGLARFPTVGAFGATDVTGSVASSLAGAADLLSVLVVVGSGLLASRVAHGDPERSILVLTGTILLLTAVASVFSPQYLTWSIGAIAIALPLRPRGLWRPAMLLAAAVAVSHVLYPVLHWDHLEGSAPVVALSVIRSVLILASGSFVARLALRSPRVDAALVRHD